MIGTPEPPLPYAVEKTFTNIQWRSPVFVIREPASPWLMVVQQGGERERPSKILRVRDEPEANQAEPFLTLSNRLIYSVTFHPGYRTNGHLYVFSNGPTPEPERTNRISRFRVDREPPFAADPASERIIIEWRSAGHDGGGMAFGHDGMFYVSTGDGTSDSDGWVTGQDLSDLPGGVLRIDVDRPGAGQAYSVPPDNPFVGWTNARPELWAYGLRNPWRLAIDEKTGHVWTGNNGQDLWETVHFVRRGENYGWSVYEGNRPFYLNRKLGPTPVVAPTIEHHHSEARSLTGGVVYHGEALSELKGAYVYGDYSSGKIWAARHDGTRVVWHRELANTTLQIAAFAVGHRGDLLIVDHAGGLYRLVRAPVRDIASSFPKRLSETGLFLSARDHRLDPGVIPYSVNAPGWADGAHVERFIGLPNLARVEASNGWAFPEGSVLGQTLSLEREAGRTDSRRRIETRLLTRQNGQWAGYSYRWDEDQTDAVLVGSKGEDRSVVIRDPLAPGGVRRQLWRHPSRTECMTCHSRAANFVLGFTQQQLNRTHDDAGDRAGQLARLAHRGFLAGRLAEVASDAGRLVDPYDSAQPLEARARSYLHVNCAVCHVEAGGGNSRMQMGLSTGLEKMNLIAARPQHDSFGIDNAMLVFPGDAERSVLYQRLARRGRGQMPPLVSTVVDEAALALFRAWIREMEPELKFVREWRMEDLTASLDKVKFGRSFEGGRTAFRQTGCNQCHRFAGEGGSVGPDLTGVGRRLTVHELLESLLQPSKVIAEGYVTTDIEMRSGDIIAGRVEREDDRVLVVRPVASEETMTIRKEEILSRTQSRISNMPAGIVNVLNETRILDLLAYLISDGDAAAGVFGGATRLDRPESNTNEMGSN